MNNVFWYCPLEWAKGVGFHKPTLASAQKRSSSSRRASNPRLDQGGSVEKLMEGIWNGAEVGHLPFTPQSRFDVVGSLRLWLRAPDHPRPDGVPSSLLGAAGPGPLRTRGSRTCLRHLLAPSLGGGGRLTPTTWGAWHSSLTSFLRALAVGGCAAVNLSSGPDTAGNAERAPWTVSEPPEGASA